MRAGVYGRQSSNKAKSIAEQIDAGHQVIGDEGWTHAGDYSDGRSASRYATKGRDDWARVLTDVQAANLDVLILWESSRGDRTAETWLAFLSDCRRGKVRIYVIKDERLYDLNKARDWKTLAEDGITSAYESELLSLRTKRGHAGAAAAGLPPGGPVPYGYARQFDTETGKRLGWVPKQPEAANVVTIFKRVGAGDPIMRIGKDLGLTTNAVRRIARNRLYLGIRVHNGREHKGTWESLVTPAAFRDAQAVLSNPDRRITRPGRQKHLLSYLAVCAVCEAPIEQAVGFYRCSVKRCVSAPLADIDAMLTKIFRERLARPDALRAMAVGDEDAAQRAQDEADRLKMQLAEWEAIAKRGKDSPARVAAIMAGLEDQIEGLEREARAARLPAVLRDVLDDPHPNLTAKWDNATVVGRRQIVKALADVRIGKGLPGRTPDIEREHRAFQRLAPSRWHGDPLTWGVLE
ncbi:recombinase family protein [Actinoplanes sp. LDG1-06]|uniref:Recombinase family protein n=1 Tax=Paractinoplanes ovalisporus TaxID=2810368 RepID=A0ABS2ALS4_9ACTN|nr:recombinase family protein [Actinoplanes ovalisporus]MBM2620166.1 recombinase family protein [Actinoplanes ovalisporus]